MADVLTLTDKGLYCAAGDFYVDPWAPVPRAIVTHGHADHARPVADTAFAAVGNEHILARRLAGRPFTCWPFGTPTRFGNATVSLHPAGHILGSAQVRVVVDKQVWVVSGDFKRAPDPTCPPFEVVPCDTFITESTFGLPLYRWPETRVVVDEVLGWWKKCLHDGLVPVLFCYALGKAQRLLKELAARATDVDPLPGGFVLHGALEKLTQAYRDSGVTLPSTSTVAAAVKQKTLRRSLVLAPPSAAGTPWMKRFDPSSTALASGWMRLRGARRRRSLDRGFILSDHADWPALVDTIAATGASRVLVTHGSQAAMVRYLKEVKGLDAASLATPFAGEGGAEVDDDNAGAAASVEAFNVDAT